MCNHLNKTYWTCICAQLDWHCQDCGKDTGHICSKVADENGATATFVIDHERHWREQIAKEIEDAYKFDEQINLGLKQAAAIARGQK